MQEPRPEAQASRSSGLVPNAPPDRLQLASVLVVHLQVREQREVISGPQAREVRLERRGQRAGSTDRLGVGSVGKQAQAALLEERSLGRQRTGSLVFFGQLPRLYLAGLDVRLVEGVDPQDRSSH